MRTLISPRSLMRTMQHRPVFSANPLWWSEWPEAKEMPRLRMNTTETSDAYLVDLLVPGFAKNAFELNVEGSRLMVKASCPAHASETNHTVLRKEFEVHSFERMFEMPEDVECSEIKAQYEGGILHLVLPKKQNAKDGAPHRIEVI